MNQLSINDVREMTTEEVQATLKTMTADEVAHFITHRKNKIREGLEALELYETVHKELQAQESMAKEPWRILDYNNDAKEWGITTHLTCWQRYWFYKELVPMMESLVPHVGRWTESATLRFIVHWCMKNQNKLSHVSEEELKQYFKDGRP